MTAGLDLAALAPTARPLATLGKVQIEAHLAAALARGDGALGAHCVHELWMRGALPARIEAALNALWARAAASIPEWLPMRYLAWLPTAYEVAGAFRARRRGAAYVYLVLLDFEERRRGPYGV